MKTSSNSVEEEGTRLRREEIAVFYEKRRLMIDSLAERKRLRVEELSNEDENTVPNIKEVVKESDDMSIGDFRRKKLVIRTKNCSSFEVHCILDKGDRGGDGLKKLLEELDSKEEAGV